MTACRVVNPHFGSDIGKVHTLEGNRTPDSRLITLVLYVPVEIPLSEYRLGSGDATSFQFDFSEFVALSLEFFKNPDPVR